MLFLNAEFELRMIASLFKMVLHRAKKKGVLIKLSE